MHLQKTGILHRSGAATKASHRTCGLSSVRNLVRITLLANAEQRSDALTIHQLELIGQEMIQIGGALNVENQHVVEFRSPPGEERKASHFRPSTLRTST